MAAGKQRIKFRNTVGCKLQPDSCIKKGLAVRKKRQKLKSEAARSYHEIVYDGDIPDGECPLFFLIILQTYHNSFCIGICYLFSHDIL